MLEQGIAPRVSFRQSLAEIVGDDQVKADPVAVSLYSEDIWSRAEVRVELIVAPDNLEQLVQVVKCAGDEGATLSVRGAGMSYTSAYIPTAPHSVSLDPSRMNRVLSIDENNMVVTVESGCTWASLYNELRVRGLRTPF